MGQWLRELLILQRTKVLFPVSMSSSSQLPITTTAGDLTASYGLRGNLNLGYIHTDTH